jgi:F-type H+-transporting ATPase subunit gamma
MPSLIDFRRRIRSVKNTQQITRAMKMVASAKLRRAQQRVLAARPYSTNLSSMLRHVAAAARRAGFEPEDLPLLAERPEKRVTLLVVTSDRGLAGAFNMNAIKEAVDFRQRHPEVDVRLVAIGRKIRDYAARRGYAMAAEYVGVVDRVRFADAQLMARAIIDAYARGETDAVYVVGNTFRSVLSQVVSVTKILPVQVTADTPVIDYIVDGDPRKLLQALLPRYVENAVLQALLESGAAEHAARMAAMDAATSNANDVIEKLTLTMNRIRQASITTEIIEVVSGAEAAG